MESRLKQKCDSLAYGQGGKKSLRGQMMLRGPDRWDEGADDVRESQDVLWMAGLTLSPVSLTERPVQGGQLKSVLGMIVASQARGPEGEGE